MTSPTPPSSPGPSTPPGPPPEGGTDLKPWLPAIGLGVVLLGLLAFFFLRSDGNDDQPTTTSSALVETTTSTTSTSTSTTTSTTPTTPTTTAAATTAPPTTAPPTTTPPTTTPPTTVPTDPANATLIGQCNGGDEFACYEVGRMGLAPPAAVTNPARWNGRSDDDVANACQVGLNVTACYVAGTRGLALGD